MVKLIKKFNAYFDKRWHKLFILGIIVLWVSAILDAYAFHESIVVAGRITATALGFSALASAAVEN